MTTSFKSKIASFWSKYWFLIGLGAVTGIAAAYPPLAHLIKSEYTVSYAAVCLIFLISGLSLKSKVIFTAVLDFKVHLLTQAFSLGVTPAIGLAVAKLLLLSDSFDVNLAIGLTVAISTPTTISSNVLMTKQCGGNESAALVNAVIGNILGVFVSPALIFAFLKTISTDAKYASIDYSGVFIKLMITVIAPLIVGQGIQFAFPQTTAKIVKMRNPSLAIINSSLLLLLVWSVMCETFSNNAFSQVNSTSLIGVIFVDLGLFILFSSSIFMIAWLSGLYSKQDVIAIVMCGATKTVALGIPMINVLFQGNPAIGVLSLPLLIYHSEQLIVGSFLVQIFAKWNREIVDGEQEDAAAVPVVDAEEETRVDEAGITTKFLV